MINLTEVLSRKGKMLIKQEELSLSAFDFPFGSFPITDKTKVSLEVENTGNRVLHLSAEFTCTVLIPCARCLDDVPYVLSLSFERELDLKQSAQDRLDALDESDFLDGYNLDVDKLVYGEALLNWPSRVLCKEDCKGLCKICGQNLNRVTCNCESTQLDPRMAGIQEIFRKMKEV